MSAAARTKLSFITVPTMLTMPNGPWRGKLRRSTLMELPEQLGCVAMGRAAAFAVNQQPAPGLPASQRPAGWP